MTRQRSTFRRLVRRLARPIYVSWRWASASGRALPDFLIIGAMQGGTSSLYNYLIQHPSLLPAMRKEVHYFHNNNLNRRGGRWYRTHFPTHCAMALRYLCHRQSVITSEATPYYIFHPEAASRIRAMCPEVKVIALLRNPVDRAYSHYQHSVRHGYEQLSFAEAVKRERAWIATRSGEGVWAPFPDAFSHQRLSYLARGLYAQQLRQWYDLFPKGQLLVLSSESMFADPGNTLQQVFDFLGLPCTAVGDLAAHNAASYAPMSADIRGRLVSFFERYNRSLYELLGTDFGWEKR
jgi:hypothetical protein